MARRAWLAWGLLLLLLTPVGLTAGTPASGAASARLANHLPSDAPFLSLVPAPSRGSAPLLVNVTAAASGGLPPYSLLLCFGTQDHSSPPPGCGNWTHGWSGAAPLFFLHRYGTPGNYSVTGILTDAQGAGVGSTALIVVTGGLPLNAQAEESGTTGAAPYSVAFTETISGESPPVSIQWQFGDGTSGSSLPGAPVTHVYTRAGVFWPSLTVTDGAGHISLEELPSVQVTPAPGFLGLGGASLWTLLALETGLFLAAAAVSVLVVRRLLSRRWRREGNELIDRIPREPAEAPREPAP